MANLLNSKSIGDIVKIRENGVEQNYVIVQKGRPSSLYGDGCDGIWLLRQNVLTNMKWVSTGDGYYDESDIQSFLNGEFLEMLDPGIVDKINTAKIPVRKEAYDLSLTHYGDNGIPYKVFLLSAIEVGINDAHNPYIPNDGVLLSYFIAGANSTANQRRYAYDNTGTTLALWATRTIHDDRRNIVTWAINTDGTPVYISQASLFGVRPAFVLPYDFDLDALSITIDIDCQNDLGVVDSGIDISYLVHDEKSEGPMSVSEYFDDELVTNFTANQNESLNISISGNDWLKVKNGEHSIKIECSNGDVSSSRTVTFERDCKTLSLSLAEPFVSNDVISKCRVLVDGKIPEDAECIYEVTNNANDENPIWEDCTLCSKNRDSYSFTNKVAINGFAFSFRITINRGSSGEVGYITCISGGFE